MAQRGPNNANRPTRTQYTRHAERRAEAWRLSISGLTPPRIAERMGISGVHAWRLVKEAIAEVEEISIGLRKEVQRQELERLDAAIACLWPKVEQGDVAAIKAYILAQERRSRLLGLDAPVKSELSGPDGTPLEVVVTHVKAKGDAKG